MTTKSDLIKEIEKISKENVGKAWKINPLDFYKGYKYRTKKQLLELKTYLNNQLVDYWCRNES